MEDYSDSDVSLESEYESDQESTPGSNCDTDDKNLEPELSETSYDEYENAP
jgi:Transposase IS4